MGARIAVVGSGYVGTPQGATERPDMSATSAAATAIGAALDGHRVIVTKSTVPIGSGRWLQNTLERAIRPEARSSASIAVVSNPEFLREGSAVHDFLHPDRLVIGSDDPAALELVADLYAPLLDRHAESDGGARPPVVRTGLATAETIKYAANAFLAAKVSFANEHGYAAPLLRGTLAVNDHQRRLVVDKLRRALRGLRGARVTLLGLAFKPSTDDLRDAPAVAIARALLDGDASGTAHDPVVRRVPECPGLPVLSDPYRAAEGADAVVLVTEWPEYRDLDLRSIAAVMRGDLFVDSRNVFHPDDVRAAGLCHDGIGRAAARARIFAP